MNAGQNECLHSFRYSHAWRAAKMNAVTRRMNGAQTASIALQGQHQKAYVWQYQLQMHVLGGRIAWTAQIGRIHTLHNNG